jgi:hypothetical protein
MRMIRASQRFGDWTITGDTRLGGGGNGEVWKVGTGDGRTGAIKVLSRRPGREGAYRLARFKDEISFLIKFPNFPGVLPMLDSHISDDPAEPSWYVMPEAIPIRKSLGTDPEPARVVTAIAEIATTLTNLAAEEVFHRDIKPDNLFKLGDKFVVGDFGLVTYPEKDPRTEHGRKLGPIDYMAPEMRADADRAAPGPADVWALGKSLWVLLTSQELPLPGTHDPSDAAQTLKERITFGFTAEIDLLLEKATRINPVDRIRMEEIAKELSACLLPPPEIHPSAGLEDLAARAAALTARSHQNWEEAENMYGRYAAAWRDLLGIANETAAELAKLLTFTHSHGAVSLGQLKLGHPRFAPYYTKGTRHTLTPPHHSQAPFEVVVDMAIRALSIGDPFDCTALISVNRNLGDGRFEADEIYTRTWRNVPVASAQQANILTEIRARFTESMEPTLRKAISILAETQ